MMNLLALCLVLSSLAAAGVWSPALEKNKNGGGDDAIVKEGHKVIVVEIDKDGRENTRVSISRETDYHDGSPKEKLKETLSVLPNLGQGLSGSSDGESDSHSSRDLICDSLGKCRHRIRSAIGKVKEKASDKVHGVQESAGEVFDKAKEAVGKAKRTGKMVVDMTDDVKTTAYDAMDKAKEVKGSVEHKAKEAKECADQKAEGAKECVKHTADKVKIVSTKVKEESQKELSENIGRGAEVFYDAINYMIGRETMSFLMVVVNLLGFASAYGMCAWVTFVSSYVLAGAMQRQQFGMVQSKLYPVYFMSMACSIGLALLGHLLSHKGKLFSHMPAMIQLYNLLASFLTVLVNLLFLEPRANQVMVERMKMEKEEVRGRKMAEGGKTSSYQRRPVSDPTATSTGTTRTGIQPAIAETSEREVVWFKINRLSKRLGRLNSYSSFLNVLCLMSLTWHLVYLSQRLQ